MWKIVKSRTDMDVEFFRQMEAQGWKLKSALYSCMDGMYHYIFRRNEEDDEL